MPRCFGLSPWPLVFTCFSCATVHFETNCSSLARIVGVFERVTFAGFRDDVPQILKACDIYVHATTSDGFGMAACEAMAAGLPVIVGDVPGLAQVVGGAGMVTPVGDHASMARELNDLACSVEKEATMSEASRRRARDFSGDKTVDL